MYNDMPKQEKPHIDTSPALLRDQTNTSSIEPESRVSPDNTKMANGITHSDSPAEASSTSFPNLDTITLDDIDLSTTADIANIPEKIGYLHEIGLNYGWGPTSMLEWLIEHIHIYSGLPWWGAVALAALGIRVAMLPLYIRSSDMTARSAALISVTKPISDRITAAKQNRDSEAMQAAYIEMMAMRRRAGLSIVTQMLPVVMQGVIGYCGFKLMRAMANLPVPALQTDGFLWLQDLTLSDPYLIIPIAMAGTMHFLIRMGGESGAAEMNQMQPQMRNVMLWGMPAIIVLMMGYQSGLVCVWFASGGALSVLQGQALKNENLRRWLKIAPLIKAGKNAGNGAQYTFMPGNQTFGGGAGAAGGSQKKAAWMNPTYQSPNLRRNTSSSGGRIIDVESVDKSKPSSTPRPSAAAANDDMIQPNAPESKKGGILAQAREKLAEFQKGKEVSKDEMARKRKEAFSRRAKAYEERLKQKGKR